MNNKNKQSCNKNKDYFQISVKNKLDLISCGYIRKYFSTRNINPNDIGCVIVKFLFNDWKFDYFRHSCEYYEKSSVHGIYNNGKTARCDCHAILLDACHSLYRVSHGMEPNSGIYEIRMKIDEINNDNLWSAIGITTASYDYGCSPVGTLDCWGYKNDCIGWSSFDHDKNDCNTRPFSNMKNGLLIGYGHKVQDNIFIKSKFVYQSNNKFYKDGLPYIKNGDTIIMKYDSNNNILSFYKLNDNKLNAQISNLPKDKIFYWFVGRYSQQLSVTIV